MQIFCAYAFTGEDLDVVTKRMRMVVDTLNSYGHEAYCNRFDPIVNEVQERDDIRGIFKRAFEVLGEHEAIAVIITSPNKSVGQIMEMGVAMSQGKPVYLFEHVSAKDSTYLSKLATKFFEWETDEELKKALKRV